MKSEAQAINDARVWIRDVIRELSGSRPPRKDRREHLVRCLNGALVELNTADIAAGRVGVGAALTDAHAEPRKASA